ncbi:Hypothetical predicted protein [Octopus vulgaris]|uniref:Carboxylic ester hydrolase n=1 Tax=Octopus vulgaris TaxID=6645 RepID=A0AA36B4N9_OCTVU|nr:Hypothetical predicted protein [Octopus vulgaris]
MLNSANILPIRIMEGLKYILIISLLKTLVHAEDPIIETTSGKINGSTVVVQNVELDVFLGIPFAKPPVGNLRFRRPEKIERWSGIKETKEHVAACAQYEDGMLDDIPGADPWKIKADIKEDCLYLNIWAPTEARKSRSNLTTMIWIYGGGFISGSSTLGEYDGRWLAVSQNIIVASLNYRVGPFGFLSLNDERAPGNMGLLDQNLAIKWIRDNIASFGGDPDKLTLFGESAGAASGTVPINNSISHKLMKEVIEPVQLNPTQLDSIFYVYGSNIYSSSETEKYRYVLDQVAGDTMFKCPTIEFSREWSTHSNVYMYSFDYRSNVSPWPEWMGSPHGSDIYYVFSRALYTTNSSSEDKEVSELMSSYFANFSKSGNPNNGDCVDCSNEPWSKFTQQSQKYFAIDKKPKMKNKDTSMYSVCDFWSDLLPKLKEPSSPVPSGSQNIWTFQGRILTTFSSIFFSLVLFWNILC